MLFGGMTSLLLAVLAVPSAAVPSPPASHADLSAPGKPANNPGTWATNADYPAMAMRERREGVTGFRLTYDASGLPQKCDIISSSGHADLDARTCELMMARARFEPGRDAAGRAAGGTYSNRVLWQVPEGAAGMGEPFPFAESGKLTLDYVVDPQGAVARCNTHIDGLVGKDADRADVGDPCAEVRAAAPYPPPRDRDGKPVARRYRMTMDVVVEDVAPGDTPPK
jgi:TonB family protein